MSPLPPFPLPVDKWNKIAAEFKFSPRHRAIVELILRNQCDKQITAATGIAKSTLRTHINRIFHRCDVDDRLTLALLLCRMSHNIGPH